MIRSQNSSLKDNFSQTRTQCHGNIFDKGSLQLLKHSALMYWKISMSVKFYKQQIFKKRGVLVYHNNQAYIDWIARFSFMNQFLVRRIWVICVRDTWVFLGLELYVITWTSLYKETSKVKIIRGIRNILIQIARFW